MTISQGEKTRRQVMGDEFVDRALNNNDDFTQPMQSYIINMVGEQRGSARGLI